MPTPTHNITPALLDRATPINKLKPHPANARRRGPRAMQELMTSLTTHGQYRTVIARRVRGGGLQLLAGHGTVEAARGLGWSHVAVDVHGGVGDDQALRIVAVDNRTSDLAEYDDALLAKLLGSVDGLEGTGYDADDYADVLSRLGEIGNEGLEDPDDAPPVAEVPLSRPGDVWVLGRHRAVCGDATQADVWRLVVGEEETVDAVWTDPPYGVDYVGKTSDALKIENDGRDLIELEGLLRAVFERACAFVKPGAAFYVAAPPGPATLPFAKVLTDAGLWRQTLVWVKNTFALGHSDYHYRHEVIYVGYAEGGGRRGRGGHGWYGPNNEDSVIEVPKPARNAEHPTMKPVELIERCLANSTTQEMIVADPFGGSGSTLIACERMGRRARVIELDPRYVDVICERWQRHTPVRADTGEPVDFTDGR